MHTESSKTKSAKTLLLDSDKDLVEIRKYGRSVAARMGFSENDRTVISTALSEICRNVIEYAGKGEVTIESDYEKGRLIITVEDDGPGIKDVDKALQEGFSSGKGLGIGLPGAKRIMDVFEIQTSSGKGTTIKMHKLLDNYNGF